MLRAYKVFLATAYSQRELVRTMKRFFACLALCASFSASAQDGCELFNFQELATENQELAIENQQLSNFIAASNTTLYALISIIDGLILNGTNLSGIANLSPDFSVVDLSGVNLSGANLISANLSYANLNGANLEDAVLNSANLYGAHLISANLNDASLKWAWLSGADLSDADLIGANLEEADLYGSDTDLTGANLHDAELWGADLTDANLTGANLHDAILYQANLYGANLTGTIMTCLRHGCPLFLPSGYSCEPDPDCSEPNRYRIVEN